VQQRNDLNLYFAPENADARIHQKSSQGIASTDERENLKYSTSGGTTTSNGALSPESTPQK
jgi:hypothetical protein